jgi:hypothetical protein
MAAIVLKVRQSQILIRIHEFHLTPTQTKNKPHNGSQCREGPESPKQMGDHERTV